MAKKKSVVTDTSVTETENVIKDDSVEVLTETPNANVIQDTGIVTEDMIVEEVKKPKVVRRHDGGIHF